MRIFSAALLHETLTPEKQQTTREDFASMYLVYNGKHVIENAWMRPIHYWREQCEKFNFEFVESLAAGCLPSGPIAVSAFKEFSSCIIQSLKEQHMQKPFDFILLYLHGAMVTSEMFDCEGELLRQIREVIGSTVPIGVLMDLHGHQTKLKSEQADVLHYFHEYPHIDLEPRAQELFDVMLKTARKEIKPLTITCPMKLLNHMLTIDEPMKSIVAFMEKQINPQEGIEMMSLAHGFPWSDVPESGVTPLVVCNSRIPKAEKKGKELAEAIGLVLYLLRDKVKPKTTSIEQALEHIKVEKSYSPQLFPMQTKTKKPLVFADYADNPGGGALGCSTFVLQEMFSRQIASVAMSSIWDKKAVEKAFTSPLNEVLELEIGGSLDEKEQIYYNKPLRLQVKIKNICEDLLDEFSGKKASKGRGAHLQILAWHDGNHWLPQRNCDVIINDIRDQTYSPKCFEFFGINPLEKDILIVKSMYHYQAAFRKITDPENIFTLAGKGRLTSEFATIPYYHLDVKSMWPMQENIVEYEEKMLKLAQNEDSVFMHCIHFIKSRKTGLDWSEFECFSKQELVLN